SASAPVVLYALPAGGMFVVGDKTAAGIVTFWSPQWWLTNSSSGGPAPASFKGFLAGGQPSCGGGWTASSGFDHPPAIVPSWSGVVSTGVVLAVSASSEDVVPTSSGTAGPTRPIAGGNATGVLVGSFSFDRSIVGRLRALPGFHGNCRPLQRAPVEAIQSRTAAAESLGFWSAK